MPTNEPVALRIGIGYSLATGKLYCKFDEFHKFCENLMGRPIFTHEFADDQLWENMRKQFETIVHELIK